MQASKLILVAALTFGFGLAATSNASARPNKRNNQAQTYDTNQYDTNTYNTNTHDAYDTDRRADHRADRRGDHHVRDDSRHSYGSSTLNRRQAKRLRRIERRQRKELRRARRHNGPGTWPVRQLKRQQRAEIASFYARVQRRNNRKS
ncbi:MAG: hypothetical protein ACI9MR_003204 [Myxococcota bacterium]|jgi:hypothetical protein